MLVGGVGFRHRLVKGGEAVVDLSTGQGGLVRDFKGPHALREEADTLYDPHAVAGHGPKHIDVVPGVEVVLCVHSYVVHSREGIVVEVDKTG